MVMFSEFGNKWGWRGIGEITFSLRVLEEGRTSNAFVTHFALFCHIIYL